MESLIASLFPPGVAVAVWAEGDPAPELERDEASAVRRAVPQRRLEFARGRACARRALGLLGVEPGPIPVGPTREPVWPEGVTGSITHCDGVVAAVAAPTQAYAGVGLDAEASTPLPDDVRELVCTSEDLRRMAEHESQVGNVWSKVLFSAKESIYKAVFPSFGRYLDFLDVDVLPDTTARTFTARASAEGSITCPGLPALRGRFEAGDSLVLTGAVLPAC